MIDVEVIDSADAFVNELQRAFSDTSVKGHMRSARDKLGGWLERIKKIEVKAPGGLAGSLEMQAATDTSWTTAALDMLAEETRRGPGRTSVYSLSYRLPCRVDSVFPI